MTRRTRLVVAGAIVALAAPVAAHAAELATAWPCPAPTFSGEKTFNGAPFVFWIDQSEASQPVLCIETANPVCAPATVSVQPTGVVYRRYPAAEIGVWNSIDGPAFAAIVGGALRHGPARANCAGS